MFKQEKYGNTIFNAIVLNIIAKFSDIALFITIFSIFTLEQVGVFGVATATASFYALFFDVGLNQASLREFSKGTIRYRDAFVSSLSIRSIVLVLTIILFMVFLYTDIVSKIYIYAIGIACLSQVVIVTRNFHLTYLKSTGNQTTANIYIAVDSIIRLFLVLLVSQTISKISVVDLYLIFIITNSFILLILLYHIRKINTSYTIVKNATFKAADFIKSGVSFGLISLVTVMQNRLDWLIINRFMGEVELAFYSVANRFYEFLIMFIGIGVTTAFPWLCRQSSESEMKMLNIIKKIEVVVGITFALSCTFSIPIVVNYIWGDKYEESIPLIKSMMPLAAISVLIVVAYYDLVRVNLEKKLILVALVSTFMQLVVNLITIPRIGAQGAVYGMYSLALSNLFMYYFLSYKYMNSSKNNIFQQIIYLLLMLIITIILTFWSKNDFYSFLVVLSFGGLLGFVLVNNMFLSSLFNSRLRSR